MVYDELIATRVHSLTSRQLTIMAHETKLTVGEIVRRFIDDGLGNQKLKGEFEHLSKLRELQNKFSDSGLMINLSLKKASLVPNFKKMVTELQNKDFSKKHKKELVEALLNRIINIFGKNSDEHKQCKLILRGRL